MLMLYRSYDFDDCSLGSGNDYWAKWRQH